MQPFATSVHSVCNTVLAKPKPQPQQQPKPKQKPRPKRMRTVALLPPTVRIAKVCFNSLTAAYSLCCCCRANLPRPRALPGAPFACAGARRPVGPCPPKHTTPATPHTPPTHPRPFHPPEGGLGRSRRYCNTESTRDTVGASPKLHQSPKIN